MSLPRIIVIDANAPTVRALFSAMSGYAEVYLFNVYNMLDQIRDNQLAHLAPGVWDEVAPTIWQTDLLIPGQSRFEELSISLLARAVRLLTASVGPADVMVFTNPQYAELPARLPPSLHTYFAHDVGRFSVDHTEMSADHELELLEQTHLALAVSECLADDLAAMTDQPVVYCPNAIGDRLAQSLWDSAPMTPPVGQPIVGCVGPIDGYLDWELLQTLMGNMPDVFFAFVGPVTATDHDELTLISKVLRGDSAYHVARPHRHDIAPYFYPLSACLHPLKASAANDRRCPPELYAYLASLKPVVCGPVVEAAGHQPFVGVYQDVQQCEALLREAIAGTLGPDQASRQTYGAGHTWSARAMSLLDVFARHAAGGSSNWRAAG